MQIIPGNHYTWPAEEIPTSALPRFWLIISYIYLHCS